MTKKKTLMDKRIEKIILLNGYIGIRDQDGWETLRLTVQHDYPGYCQEILDKCKPKDLTLR